jgi:ubiquinone/menaquinone biosynthesis C-methylase UbiE
MHTTAQNPREEIPTLEDEIRAFIDRWHHAAIVKDLVAAKNMREEHYSVTFSDGRVIKKAEELTLIASANVRLEAITIDNLRVRGRGDAVTASFKSVTDGEYMGARINVHSLDTLSLRRTNGQWRALSLRKQDCDKKSAASSLPTRVSNALRRRLRRAIPSPSFQELAFVPYHPGANFILPKPESLSTRDGELPIPPEELWLGYNYPAWGNQHVTKMLELVQASGLELKRGDRILDLGCGAGRMIRHLRHLADTCEIWGTDISAPHIYWAKQHLSPPFNFATTTKIPHLPFEDRSFHLIYCGSVFTHIDDLADGWLLELHRILAPEGRLYVTIHDNHTVDLFESGKLDAEIVTRMRSRPTYQQAKHDFGMFTIGRDADSQVFYHIDYFRKMVQTMYDILSITPEAYFYQTALVLKRKR